MSSNIRTIFLPPPPKMCSFVDKNKEFDDEVGIVRNELSFFVDFIDVSTPANFSQT